MKTPKTPLNVVSLSFATYKPGTGNKPFREPDTATIKAIIAQPDQKLVDIQSVLAGKFATPAYVQKGAKATIDGRPANGTILLFNHTEMKFKNGVLSEIINPVKY